jgi:tRNA G18 (ribose-2'-O)-methylase SpoU
MKTIKQSLIGAVLLLVSGLALSHGNHMEEAPITKEAAAARGEMIVGALVEDKKLASSWQQKKLKEVASKVTPAGALWVVSFNNPAEKDKGKQTIYILLDDVGNYVGANHTGKY